MDEVLNLGINWQTHFLIYWFFVQTLLNDREELQKELTALNEKLSFVLIECNRKDEFAKHQTEAAKEAIAGKLLVSCANITSAYTHRCSLANSFEYQYYV